jgi:hypothetical protein
MEVRRLTMRSFVFAYRATTDDDGGSQEAGKPWLEFFEHLGSNVVDVGNPVFVRQHVRTCGAETVLGGYSIVNAADLASAIARGEECPLRSAGGGVEVGELTRLNPAAMQTTAADHGRATA